MTIAVIGARNLGSRMARRLAEGGVEVVIAAENRGHAESVAQSIGNGVRAVEVAEAVASADQLVFASGSRPRRTFWSSTGLNL
jgi:predicted dinucleotide-binding enzyme